jgi:hypothetical protein
VWTSVSMGKAARNGEERRGTKERHLACCQDKIKNLVFFNLLVIDIFLSWIDSLLLVSQVI